MRIVAVGDSLGLPRPHRIMDYSPKEQSLAVSYGQVYTSLLQKKLTKHFQENLFVEIINRAKRFSTIKDIASEFGEYLFFYEPDIIILQVGIVDCWYRDNLENGQRQLVNIEDFQIYFNQLKMLLNYRPNCKLIIIGICPSSEKMYNRYQGLENEISQYNKIYKKAIDNERIFYIDMEKYVDFKNPHQYLLPDDHHLNVEGNRLVANFLYDTIIGNNLFEPLSKVASKNNDIVDSIKAIQKEKKLYVFGAGKAGIELQKTLMKENIEIQGFLDNDLSKRGNVLNRKLIFHPSDLSMSELSNIFIIISSMHWKEIHKQLKQLNLKYNKDYFFYMYSKDCLSIY